MRWLLRWTEYKSPSLSERVFVTGYGNVNRRSSVADRGASKRSMYNSGLLGRRPPELRKEVHNMVMPEKPMIVLGMNNPPLRNRTPPPQPARTSRVIRSEAFPVLQAFLIIVLSRNPYHLIAPAPASDECNICLRKDGTALRQIYTPYARKEYWTKAAWKQRKLRDH